MASNTQNLWPSQIDVQSYSKVTSSIDDAEIRPNVVSRKDLHYIEQSEAPI